MGVFQDDVGGVEVDFYVEVEIGFGVVVDDGGQVEDGLCFGCDDVFDYGSVGDVVGDGFDVWIGEILGWNYVQQGDVFDFLWLVVVVGQGVVLQQLVCQLVVQEVGVVGNDDMYVFFL